MSSILTNNSAMVALQTLKSINNDLSKTQSMISTGLEVASAKDNSAVWAISKVMESDVKGFKAISESLSLGESSVAVARNAAETVTDLLTDMKEKIVAAQGENIDRTKLQAGIDALSDQVSSVVGAAQFNGLNLLQGTDDVNVLASLDRSSTGEVTPNNITVTRQDLSADKGVYGTGADLSGNVTAADGAGSLAGGAGAEFSATGNTMTLAIAAPTAGASNTFTLQVAGETVNFTSAASGNTATTVATGLTAALNAAGIEDIAAENVSGVITITSTSGFDDVEVNYSTSDSLATVAVNGGSATSGGVGFTDETITARASTITFGAAANVAEGDGYRVSIGGQSYDYIAGKGETTEDVVRGLKSVIDGAALADITTKVTQDSTTDEWVLQLDNAGTDVALAAEGAAGGEATGGLIALGTLDVTTDNGVDAALANIETMINTTIDAAAEFGSTQGRIETQSDFISQLTDSLRIGIGALVDADMEAASARLQALQVQQQLGVQSLSIANQAPQTIRSVFR
ncbi:flagellin [Yoonia sp.]|uniref:flagellin N-terminal helical domain-containing protein n=1 Tax=Yoonia sp. TaxID=2212373 RepID=UPI0035C7F05B